MISNDFLHQLWREQRQPGVLHEIQPPLSEDELSEWRSRHPDLKLPDDLIALARTANGIFLYVHKSSPDGYVGIAPLA
ncbi:MAG TPA: SMI1/KNR4 family protein, partial [Nocardioides sp.]